MSTVQKIALIFTLLIFANSTLGQSGYVIYYDNGEIDWGNHTIRTQGIGGYDPDLTPSQHRLSGTRNARKSAEGNLLNILMNFNFTCDKTVRDLMLTSVEIANRVEELVKQYRIIGKPHMMQDSSIAINIEFTLSGELMDELMNASEDLYDYEHESSGLPLHAISIFNPVYFDCRGFSIEPAIAPVITSSSGDTLFTLGIVDYSVLADGAVVKYISQSRTDFSDTDLNLIGVREINKCDLVISDFDFDTLVSSGVYINALKNGQIIFLVD